MPTLVEPLAGEAMTPGDNYAEITKLKQRVWELEQTVAELRKALAELREAVGWLERRQPAID
jgi:phage shock protein A